MTIQPMRRGYTLIELSVAITLLGLVAVLLWRFGSVASQRIAETETPQILAEANQALIGFVAAKHRLPCVDSDGDGEEDLVCSATVGRLPLVTLGLARADLRNVRYGVYRSAVANLDGTAVDRYFPLVTTATDEVMTVLGIPVLLDIISAPYYSGFNLSDPSTLSYHYGSAGAAITPLGNVNGIDFCYALRQVGTSAADASALNIPVAVGDKNIAYALALPGARDADGDGNPFDGNNVTVGSFAAPGQAVSANYDDAVRSVDFGQLFDRMSCGGVLSAAEHAHFNAATAAALTHAGFVNYKSQLQLSTEIASANNLLAWAAFGTASADWGATTAGVSFAVAEALLTSGITAALVAVSIFDETVAAAAWVAAGVAAGLATADWVSAYETVNDFQPMLEESAALEISIRNNAKAADAAGLY